MDKEMTSQPVSPPRIRTHRGTRAGKAKRSGQATEGWVSATLKVTGFPSATTTEDLYAHFSARGTLVNVMIANEGMPRTAALTYLPIFKSIKEIEEEKEPVMELLQVGRDYHSVNVQQLGWAPELIDNPRTKEKIPGKMMLRPEVLQFGVLTNANEMAARRHLVRTINTDLSANFDLKHGRLEIGFSYRMINQREDSKSTGGSRGLDGVRDYKLQVRLNQIAKMVSIQQTDGRISVLVIVRSPPLFYKKRDDIMNTHSGHAPQWKESKAWQRVTDVMYDTDWLKDTKTALVKPDQDIDIGRWLAYQLYVNKSENRFWGRLLEILKDFNIDITETPCSTISPTGFVTSVTETPGLQGILDSHATPKGALAALCDDEDWHLPFVVRYQLEVCISQGFLVEDNITKEFLAKLSQLSRTQRFLSNPAADLLTYVSDEGQVIYDPMRIFGDRRALLYRPYFRLPEYCEWVRKVTITPTTMYVSTPIPETTNRVLRQYRKYADRFLRVQFTEERSLGRLYEDTDTGKKAALFDRIHRTLKNGIELAGRHYQFLAFGNSQFREHGAYFFHPTSDLTCDHIRSWMGDFSHIKVVAKFAARMGQCLSTTRTVHNLPAGADIRTIPDIEKNGWCFTDGVGKVSLQLAGHIADALGMYDQGAVPSAFQFRLGGSKGLLVAWPSYTRGSSQLPLNFNQLHLRPSQMKFRAGSKSIEIVKGSSFSMATLNRQTITILRALGVADQVFVDMATQQDKEYRKALKDEETALGLLRRHSDPNGTNEILSAMVKSGFMRGNEPSMMALLSSWLAWCLKQLKEKARLVVEHGAFLFGCVDETNTLRGWYNANRQNPASQLPQIFVQVPEDAGSGEYVVKTGVCVVGRNPSLHPGDLRVVEAVDVPELRHVRNVVVFPAEGDRDIPSMCSGGDLDGDDYFVIWDPRLVPTLRNVQPMVDEVSKPLELDRDVQISDIQDFFVEHIKNNSLSMIAQSHLAYADSYGAHDTRCIRLAGLHSKAVDYIKSGQPARLTPDLRARKWPHFMEKPWDHNYHSRTALGRIYDSVQNMQANNLECLDSFDVGILQRFKLKEEELLTARALKVQYDTTLARVMAQQEIETEFEIYTTFALTRSKLGSDYKRHEEIGSLRGTLHQRCIATAVREAGPKESHSYRRFVAACYRVTWEHVCLAKSQDSPTPFITFPWVFWQELCNMVTDKNKSGEVEDTMEETDLIDMGHDAGGQTEADANVETEAKNETKNVQKKLEPSGVWNKDITPILDRFLKADENPERQPPSTLHDLKVTSKADENPEQQAPSALIDFETDENPSQPPPSAQVGTEVDESPKQQPWSALIGLEMNESPGQQARSALVGLQKDVEENPEQQPPSALDELEADENLEQQAPSALFGMEVDESSEEQTPSVLDDWEVDSKADENTEHQPSSTLFDLEADENLEQQAPSALINLEADEGPKQRPLSALVGLEMNMDENPKQPPSSALIGLQMDVEEKPEQQPSSALVDSEAHENPEHHQPSSALVDLEADENPEQQAPSALIDLGADEESPKQQPSSASSALSALIGLEMDVNENPEHQQPSVLIDLL